MPPKPQPAPKPADPPAAEPALTLDDALAEAVETLCAQVRHAAAGAQTVLAKSRMLIGLHTLAGKLAHKSVARVANQVQPL